MESRDFGREVVMTRQQFQKMQDDINVLLSKMNRMHFWIGVGISFPTGLLGGFLLWFGA
jgi:hypothetical protein